MLLLLGGEGHRGERDGGGAASAAAAAPGPHRRGRESVREERDGKELHHVFMKINVCACGPRYPTSRTCYVHFGGGERVCVIMND